ncbi:MULTISPECIES: response regulator [Methanosarcina]|uniref:Chemotaxis regulator-transmits chemoreceptor signals to flagelllar motor components CheY n=1 Tax=Methanosarcina vacuolata Z-761 TaxID=1434123 RepID=A0A0E3Q7A9_9EURY|nr:MULTISPECIES: response regulator [Methanosarcina]AKB44473.1 Chemotaxis regulator - transmits chemoreceptor signals to flagelllar motor components CheY [Methanosarcina vacuolata Z-761]
MARVMIVEDAEFMRMAIRDTLFKHGHEVVAEVADDDEALEKYLEVKPDLVLMDITMPDSVPDNVNWKNLLNKFLIIDQEAKMAMFSSLGQQILITESPKIGAMGFMVNPFDPGMLSIIRIIAEPN